MITTVAELQAELDSLGCGHNLDQVLKDLGAINNPAGAITVYFWEYPAFPTHGKPGYHRVTLQWPLDGMEAQP